MIASALALRAGTAEADQGAAYLALADLVIWIGPAEARKSYLNIAVIVAAARVTGAGLVRPGYGFLSENVAFAEALAAAGLTLIGPDAAAMRVMGDKVAANSAMIAAGVPCVAGPDSALPQDPALVRKIAQQIGFPVILRAAGGGGGRGMRVVRDGAGLEAALLQTRQEAQRFFGNPSIYMEKFLETPRHVEILVIADLHGNALCLGIAIA